VKTSRALSLVEILVVLVIVVILAALTLPAINSMGRSSALNGTVQSVTGVLDLARQTAMSQNRPVEVRFYKLPDAAQSPSAPPSVYRAMQTFLVDFESTNVASKMTRFSTPVIMSDTLDASSLLDDTNLPEQAAPAGFDLPEYGSNYRYRSFRFKPDGGMDLPLDGKWFFTLYAQNDTIVSNGLPANFATVEIQPLTGRTKVMRPQP